MRTPRQHSLSKQLRTGLGTGQLQHVRANVAKWAALAAALAAAAQWPDMEAVLTALAQQAAAGARAELLPLMQVRCQTVSVSKCLPSWQCSLFSWLKWSVIAVELLTVLHRHSQRTCVGLRTTGKTLSGCS